MHKASLTQYCSFFRLTDVVGFGVGAGANILARYAVSVGYIMVSAIDHNVTIVLSHSKFL